MTSPYRRATQMAALLALIAVSAEAQELAGSFEQLRVLVKPGDTLTITDGTGQRMRGKLTQLSSSSLVLDVAGALRQFQESDVNTIEKRGSDSLRNGALIGMAVGGGIAGIGIAASANSSDADASLFVFGTLVYAGVGAAIGMGIDALIEGRRVIYAGSHATRTTLNISPIVHGGRRGVLMSVRLTK